MVLSSLNGECCDLCRACPNDEIEYLAAVSSALGLPGSLPLAPANYSMVVTVIVLMTSRRTTTKRSSSSNTYMLLLCCC